VLPPILQHVNQRIADLARRPQSSCVKPITPDAAAPSEDPVHSLRDADGESLDPAREDTNIQRFDQQMDVIALHGEMQHAQAAARGLRQSAADCWEDRLGAQRREPVPRP